MSNKKCNTLDSYHKKIMNDFKQNNNKKTSIENKIKVLKNKLQNIEKKKLQDCSDIEIKSKLKIKLDIKNLEKELDIYNNNKQETTYLIKTMDLLSVYYDKSGNRIVSAEKKQQTSIFDFINNKNNRVENQNLNTFIVKNTKINKTDIYAEYLDKINENSESRKVSYVNNYTYCNTCKQEKVLNVVDSVYICNKCGDCSYTIMDSEKIPYKEPVIEMTNFSYKRYGHFCEWLSKFQGLEPVIIPQEAYDKILTEIDKQKIKDYSKIDCDKMKRILKKTGYSKYYDQVFHIINKINNKPPPKLSKEVEEKMRIMFKKTQEPFSKICPDDRTNFLSYSYVIRKFLGILNQRQYMQYFPLLKSKEKLYQQDMMWKAICKELNWKFEPSI